MSPVKSQPSDLAIFGGIPAFKTELHVGRPNPSDRRALLNRLNDVLDRNWLTNDGPLLREFEQRLCEFLSVEHCVCVCNATAGLEILARALGLSGEVILPSFTFIATAHALRWLGLTPVFCDVDPVTYNINPQEAAKLITSRTTAILGVHVWGRPCDIDALVDLAQQHHLKLLFDAAHAFGCSYNKKMIGNFADTELFSFHATKFIHSFEGGAITTNDDRLAAKLRLMRNFGFAGVDTVTCLGINAKMSEVSAAMGLTSLENLESFVDANRNNYRSYHRQLAHIPGISMVRYDETERGNFQYIVLEVNEREFGVTRDQLDDILWAEKVLSRRYFYPGCHRMEPYRTENPQVSARLAETEKLADKVLCLPTGAAVGSEEINTISQIVQFVACHNSAVRERLSQGPLHHHPLRKYFNRAER